MSYNIDTVRIVSGTLYMTADTFHKWKDHDRLPEDNLFVEVEGEFEDLQCSKGHSTDGKAFCGTCGEKAEAGPKKVKIERFAWRGEFSGNSYYDPLPKIVAELEGEADLILVWEGGDSLGGARIKDGVITEHEIVQSLGPPCKKQTEGFGA